MKVLSGRERRQLEMVKIFNKESVSHAHGDIAILIKMNSTKSLINDEFEVNRVVKLPQKQRIMARS